MIPKLVIDRPVIVEGKFDREKLSRVIDAKIITTGGFSVFSSSEKRQLITRLAEKNGVIVLTDSDGAGNVIRNYFRSILPKEKLINLYIPQIEGREKRKRAPSKAGYLGVEGMDEELLRNLFLPFSSDMPRDAVSKAAGLPAGMSSGALLEALNMLYSREKALELINTDHD